MERINSLEKFEQKERGIKERGIEEPLVSIYYIRHGESSEDKVDPFRGLTERGVEQVEHFISKFSNEVTDKTTQIRIYSSGSERTQEQSILAASILKDLGYQDITIDEKSIPKRSLEKNEKWSFVGVEKTEDEIKESILSEGITIEGPGIQKRVAELNAPRDYKVSLRDKEKADGVSAVMHWLTEKQYPEGVEKPCDKVRIVDEAIESSQKLAMKLRKNNSAPVVALVFGHSSTLTAFIADKFNQDPKNIGEVENAEGVCIKLNGVEGDTAHYMPFGDSIEKKI